MSKEDLTIKVVEKIKNLISLAEGSSNPNESEMARNRYEELLKRYGITKEELDSWNGYGLFTERVNWLTSRRSIWEMQLVAVVSNEYNCLAFSSDKSFQIVGKQDDTRQAAYMTQQLMVRLSQAASDTYKARSSVKRAFAAYGQETKKSTSAVNWKLNFLVGAVAGVREQFKLKNESYVWRHSGESAIVPTPQVSTEEAIRNENPEMKSFTPETKMVEDRNAQQVGFLYGSRMNLFSGLTQGTDYKLLM